jgi:hypothetical protein
VRSRSCNDTTSMRSFAVVQVCVSLSACAHLLYSFSFSCALRHIFSRPMAPFTLVAVSVFLFVIRSHFCLLI